MNDEQCMAIVDAIKDLSSAMREVSEKIDNIGYYSDYELKKEIHLIAEILEDIKDYRL